jgi:hypothetical protein
MLAKDMTEKTNLIEAGQSEVKFFERYLQETAPCYFKNLKSGNFGIKLMGSSVRPQSRLYRYRLEANGWKHSVLVKVPLVRQGISSGVEVQGDKPIIDRPRLAPVTNPDIKSELEYKALSEIFEHFSGMNDPRFAAVRVIDYIQDFGAILMEEVTLPSLNQLFLRASRLWLGFSPDNLNESFRNAGTWLRMYHQLPKNEDVKFRHTERFEFIESITDFTEYLGIHLKDKEYFDDIAKTLKITSIRALPESLPLGLAHGDFAMRNILIGSNSQVTVLDTLAKWRSPIFEDIGYFLVGLKTAGIQVFTRSLAFSMNCLQRYEGEFLLGYFHKDTVPYSVIRLFEIQALLDKWSARLADLKLHGQRKSSFKDSFKLHFINHHFRELLNQIVLELH